MKATGATTFLAAIPNTGVSRYVRAAATDLFGDVGVRFADADGPGADVMPKMVNELAYDVCDMSPSSLAIAFDRGLPIRALPIVTLCGFPFGELHARVAAAIDGPADLRGKTIGIRTWTNPIKPWLFGMLRDDYGVDWRACRWIATVADPIRGVDLPPNAVRSTGTPLAEALRSGSVDAAISPGKLEARDVLPVFPDPLTTAAEWYERTQILPVLHLLAIKQETLERAPWFAAATVRAFTEAKRAYLAHLRSADPPNDMVAAGDRFIMERLGIDPVPYGIEESRASLALFGAYLADHGYVQTPPDLEAFFVEARLVS